MKRHALTLAGVLLVAGCTGVVDGEAPSPRPEPPRPELAAPIQWGRCEAGLDLGAQCGEMTVAVADDKPEDGSATIALIRFRARGEKIGSLVVDPGGPGGSGVEFAAALYQNLPVDVRERFDLVGFDPRGVGRSRPAVECNSAADVDRDRVDSKVDYSPEGVARIEQNTKDYVQRCIDKTGKPFLANVGTASVVKDLEKLRAALGDDKLTYLGYSYGTFIGGLYAEAYPDKVRAMVLDGAVDPSADPIQLTLDQNAAFQLAFNNFAAKCALSADCPLGTDPAKATVVFHSLVDPLVQKPAPTWDPRGLSYRDAIDGTALAMYSPRHWDNLTRGLAALRDGGKPDLLRELADFLWERNRDGSYANTLDVFRAVSCVDVPFPRDRESWVRYDQRFREVAPFMVFGEFTGNAPLDVCALWPVPPTSTTHRLSAPGLPQVLVVSTTGDPATPYQNGVTLADQLHASLLSLLTIEGTQHTGTFVGGVPCLDEIVTSYLIDLKLPPPDTKCPTGKSLAENDWVASPLAGKAKRFASFFRASASRSASSERKQVLNVVSRPPG